MLIYFKSQCNIRRRYISGNYCTELITFLCVILHDNYFYSCPSLAQVLTPICYVKLINKVFNNLYLPLVICTSNKFKLHYKWDIKLFALYFFDL